VIAVHRHEAVLYGCPRCGKQKGYILSLNTGSAVFQCANCTKIFLIVEDTLSRSIIPVEEKDGVYYPEVSPHPLGPYGKGEVTEF